MDDDYKVKKIILYYRNNDELLYAHPSVSKSKDQAYLDKWLDLQQAVKRALADYKIAGITKDDGLDYLATEHGEAFSMNGCYISCVSFVDTTNLAKELKDSQRDVLECNIANLIDYIQRKNLAELRVGKPISMRKKDLKEIVLKNLK